MTAVALDGTVSDGKIRFLVDMRYELTNGRGLASPVYVFPLMILDNYAFVGEEIITFAKSSVARN